MNQLAYSNMPPSQPGWYWAKGMFQQHPDMEIIVHVFPRPGHTYLCIQFDSDGPRDFRAVKRMTGVKWAGPIGRPSC